VKEETFLKHLLDEVKKYDDNLELTQVKRSDGISVSKVLEQLWKDLKYKRVILAFPDRRFCEGQLMETVNMVRIKHLNS
jgi:hypothetical protein